jgi:Holliday junction resolvase-like predicted endonuclease
LAAQYLARHHVKDRLCRFDVVLLQAKDGAAPQIEHIQNAFEVSGDDLRW